MQTLLVVEVVMYFMGVHSSYNVIQGAEHHCILRQFMFNPLKQCFQPLFYGETHKIILTYREIPTSENRHYR